MIKIGEFSKISRVTIKALRHYDEMDLLKPVQVDPFTGYRYYNADQLLQLNRILALKDLGISLEQIRHLINSALSSEQMIGILRQRQVELEQTIKGDEERLERVVVRLKQFEQEKNMSTVDVVIKSVPAITIASVRGNVPTYPSQGSLWDQLGTVMQKAGVKPIGPCFTIDHDKEYRETEHDLEVCEPIAETAKVFKPVSVRTLPAEKEMASLMHHGPFTTLPQSYQKMLKWLEENKYQISGPGREIYISVGEGELRQDDPSYVTEIQFPVQRV